MQYQFSGHVKVMIHPSSREPLPFENGIFVLHEGGFLQGNASVSYLNMGLDSVTNNVFSSVNSAPLGDTAQSLTFNDDLAYIVVNNSQKVEVVNKNTFESVATVNSDLLNPRYIAFANNKGYITNWGDGTNADDDYIAVLDLENFEVESTIAVPEGPEWIISKDNKLYVAHQGGFGQNNIVSVIDATSNTIETSITVADRPNSMQIVGNDLWVLSGGNPSWTGNETAGQLDKIDLSSDAVTQTLTFGLVEHPSYLSTDGQALYYVLDGNVFKMASNASSLPTNASIEGVSFYDMTVYDNKLYAVDAKDFASPGSLEVYDLSNNSSLGSFEVSIIPGGVYFN